MHREKNEKNRRKKNLFLLSHRQWHPRLHDYGADFEDVACMF